MLGSKINELRKSKGLTLKELGEILNLGESTMSMYENNKRSPDYGTLESIADYFNVSTDYLLGRTDTKNTDKIANSLIDDEDLSIFWDDLKEREDLQLLFKQTKDLSPKGIQQVIRIIKAIEDEEDRENE